MYQCADDNITDWQLLGNFYRNDMLYLEIKLWKCQNQSDSNTVGVQPGVICQSQTDIDNYINAIIQRSIHLIYSRFSKQMYYLQGQNGTYRTLVCDANSKHLFRLRQISQDLLLIIVSQRFCMLLEAIEFQYYVRELGGQAGEDSLHVCCQSSRASKICSHYINDYFMTIHYFRKQSFNFAFINNQFTTDDYEKPVHRFIDDQLFFEIDPSVSKKANFYVQNAEASLEDTLLQLGWSNDINFHQVNNVRYYDDDYNSADGFIIAVFIRADKMYDSYSRQVTDILTLLGDVGGLQEFFMMIGGLLTSFVASKLFMSSIVKKIYHIRKYDNIDYEATKAQASNSGLGTVSMIKQNESYLKRLAPKVQPSPLSRADETIALSNRQDSINTTSSGTAFQQILDAVKEEEKMLSTEFKSKKTMRGADIYSLFFAFLNRARFSYTPNDIFIYAIKCLCYRDTGDARREKNTKKHFLFEKAEEKFMNELDVVRIIRSLRKFKMLAQALLTQKHRMILRFQRQNLVETSSSSSDSDNNLYDPVRLMESKNPLVRLVTYGKFMSLIENIIIISYQNGNPPNNFQISEHFPIHYH